MGWDFIHCPHFIFVSVLDIQQNNLKCPSTVLSDAAVSPASAGEEGAWGTGLLGSLPCIVTHRTVGLPKDRASMQPFPHLWLKGWRPKPCRKELV